MHNHFKSKIYQTAKAMMNTNNLDQSFFDLTVVDECQRGSAKEDSKWYEILGYFKTVTHTSYNYNAKGNQRSSLQQNFLLSLT
jgi:type I site-specific restriction endonuclease